MRQTIFMVLFMPENAVSPKSIDRRDRPVPVRLPIEVQLFYEFQGKLVREASLTRTMEQFLIDRAGVMENKQELAAAIVVRAKILGMSPQKLIETELITSEYDQFMDVSATAEALCVAWGVDTDE